MAARLIPLIAAVLIASAGCGSERGRADPTTARALPAAAKGVIRMVAVGDSAGGAKAAEVARLVRREHPDRFLYLGDVYPNGSAFAAYARAYGGLKPITAPTPGNHDWGPGYRKYWHGKPEWYSVSAGSWQIISLNSETNRRRAQLAYLRKLLRARGTCRIAIWHRPRYSGGVHGDNPDMDPYWRALQGHARLVINGHDHDMQRFAPRAGLTELISGAGGESR